jgi:thioredoxin reductase (NADPH)
MDNTHKCIIIGSGPAGYTAAIYASRAGLNPIVFEGGQPGGQLTTTTEVDNFPGYPQGIDGTALMEDLKKQAERFGTTVIRGQVSEVDFSGDIHKIVVDGEKEYFANTVIISTGATAKYLGIEAETKYAGMGVSACATCDGFFYRGRKVAVVGGGDTACEEASYLSGLAEKVYLIVRKDYLRASKAMQDRVNSIENIEILYKRNAIDLYGDNGVEGVVLVVNQGEEMNIKKE